MRIFITFGDEKFHKSRNFAAYMAKVIGGFDKVIIYKPEDIDENFKEAHKDIFDIKRGYGLWIWKPYFIFKTLVDVVKEGDYLFYGDAGSFFIRNIKHIEKTIKNNIWVSHNSLVEWQFTKKDAIELMESNNSIFLNTAQAQGGFLYIRKTDESMRFIKEWLDLCCDIRLLHPDNIFTGQANPLGFVGHREDQSLLSLLCKKENVLLHKDPTQYGKYPEKYWNNGVMRVNMAEKVDGYPVSIILHRTPNVSFSVVLKQLILALMPRKLGLYFISYDKQSISYNYGSFEKVNTGNGGGRCSTLRIKIYSRAA